MVLLALLVAVLAVSRAPAQALPPPRPTGTPVVTPDVAVDRTTPRRSLQSFLTAARDGDFATAALCLDVRGDPDPTHGASLAEELSYVLYRRAPIDLSKVPDDPSAADGAVTVDTFTVGEQDVPFLFARVRFEDGIHRWVIARSTVRQIPDIAATVRTARWELKLPKRLRDPVVLGNAPWQWLGILVALSLAYAVGRFGSYVIVRMGDTLARRHVGLSDGLLREGAVAPLRTIVASMAFGGFLVLLQTSLIVTRVLAHGAYTGFVTGLAWLLLVAFNRLARALASPEGGPGAASDAVELDQAGARTRRALLQRVASALVVAVTISLLLVQFDVVRHVGLSILASAGIVGVVVGLAAQKSLAGLIAGIQLSITQPVRIGDTLLIDGELGTVEDIFLTYAVVRFWDDRSLVVPLSRFLEQPFQNLTLLRRDLPAVVLLHVKFTAPINDLRGELRRLCEENPAWDKRFHELHVSDSDMYGLVLRANVSARSPKEAWALRCAIREGLVKFLQTRDGGAHMG